VASYELFCDDATPANRRVVLREAKALDKLMTSAQKKAVASAGGFAGASPATRRHTATLDDINNNLRLVVDVLRRQTEIMAHRVSMLLACV
jgi:hypothetical protein